MSSSKDAERAEKNRIFEEFLNKSAKPKICDSCSNVRYEQRGGYKNPCKAGHESRFDLAACESHPDSKYHPKK